ncbi:hypothetical protein D3C76_1522640 [compost metagenome]
MTLVVVDLLERAEDGVKSVLGYSDPGIPDGDLHEFSDHGGLDANFALLRKFNGVAQQIKQNLVEPILVRIEIRQ